MSDTEKKLRVRIDKLEAERLALEKKVEYWVAGYLKQREYTKKLEAAMEARWRRDLDEGFPRRENDR